MYSILWAQEVVEAHYKAHTRASYFMLVSHGYTTRTLGLWLAKRDPRWELYKAAVLVVENHMDSDTKLLFSKLLYSKLTHLYAKRYEMGGSQAMLDLEEGFTLGLQVLKGTTGGRADEKTTGDLPGQLLLFDEGGNDAAGIPQGNDRS